MTQTKSVHYLIGFEMPGARIFDVELFAYPPTKTVTGRGHIAQPIYPPVIILTKLEGHYTSLSIIPPGESHILITTSGYPENTTPPHENVAPVIPPIVYLNIVLAKDWQSGVASYRYNDGNEWREMDNVPVKALTE